MKLPKTRNAYAMAGFDKERILQRPFFKGFEFAADKTDVEILQSLSLSDGDSSSLLEHKRGVLYKIVFRLTEFFVRIDRHSKRLGKYLMMIKKKFNNPKDIDVEFVQNRLSRGNALFFRYSFDIAECIGDLREQFFSCGAELEIPLQNFYRREFGERLRQAREKAKMSRSKAGELIGLSPNGYGQYERGTRDPSLMSLIRLSRAFNVSADWLLGIAP